MVDRTSGDQSAVSRGRFQGLNGPISREGVRFQELPNGFVMRFPRNRNEAQAGVFVGVMGVIAGLMGLTGDREDWTNTLLVIVGVAFGLLGALEALCQKHELRVEGGIATLISGLFGRKQRLLTWSRVTGVGEARNLLHGEHMVLVLDDGSKWFLCEATGRRREFISRKLEEMLPHRPGARSS